MKNFWKDEQGQDLIEYSLLLAFIALFGTTLYGAINANLTTIWTNTDTLMTTASGT